MLLKRVLLKVGEDALSQELVMLLLGVVQRYDLGEDLVFYVGEDCGVVLQCVYCNIR